MDGNSPRNVRPFVRRILWLLVLPPFISIGYSRGVLTEVVAAALFPGLVILMWSVARSSPRPQAVTYQGRVYTGGWDRPLPDKIAWMSFVVLCMFSYGYGSALYVVNALNPEIIQWIAQYSSTITDPIARILPVTRYAEGIADPQGNLTAPLIRHVFSFLTLVNLVAVIALFGLCRAIARMESCNLALKSGGLKQALSVSLLIVALFGCLLFVLPLFPSFDVAPNMPPKPRSSPMGLPGYFLTCVSPTFFFFFIFRVVVLAWARRIVALRGQPR